MNEKTLKDTTVFDGHLIRVHVDDVELDNGMVAKREIVSHPGGVSVAILTEKNELLFVKQFRCPYQEELLELPAGKLEPGEDPFEAMKREQLEETGTTGKNYISLGNLYPTPGYCGKSSACGPAGWTRRPASSPWTPTSSCRPCASPWTRPWRWCCTTRSPTAKPRWAS